MGALLPLLPIIEDLLTYYTVQALVEALVEAGIIPAELAPLLGAQLPDVSGTQIDQDVQQIQRTLDDQTNGLPGIITLVKRTALDKTDILNKLDQLVTQVSNIPAAPGVGDIAAQVWGYPNSGEDIPAYTHLLYLERYAALTSQYGSWPWLADPMFTVSGAFKYPPD